MALTKKTPTKSTKKRKVPKASIVRSGATPVRDLRVYHKNPRIGDIDSIAESLDLNGQYRSIVVNVGTNATHQMEVLAGNHTFMAARKLGWETILADFVDVTDDRARAIVLADNKTAENGTYDEKLMGELLSQVPDIAATGFKPEEADSLIAQASATADAIMSDLSSSGALDIDVSEPAAQGDDMATGSTSLFGVGEGGDTASGNDDDEDFLPEAEPESKDAGEITNRPSEIEGVSNLAVDLPEDKKFYQGYFQMPSIRTDMLMQPDEWPENIVTWAGSASRELAAEKSDQWFHYPWGGDSTKGMVHLNQVVLSFYSWDDAFENWFWTPNKYAAKILNSGIKYAITPDYSMWTSQSRFLNLWAQYRNLYVARYLQEVGVKIIPHIGIPMGDIEFTEKYILRFWPKSAPIIANELQNFNPKEVEQNEADMIRQWTMIFDHFEDLEMFVLYTSQAGRKWFESKFAGLYPNVKIVYMDTRLDLLSAWKKANGMVGQRKKTI